MRKLIREVTMRAISHQTGAVGQAEFRLRHHSDRVFNVEASLFVLSRFSPRHFFVPNRRLSPQEVISSFQFPFAGIGAERSVAVRGSLAHGMGLFAWGRTIATRGVPAKPGCYEETGSVYPASPIIHSHRALSLWPN
jgi:hypothetical protein